MNDRFLFKAKRIDNEEWDTLLSVGATQKRDGKCIMTQRKL